MTPSVFLSWSWGARSVYIDTLVRRCVDNDIRFPMRHLKAYSSGFGNLAILPGNVVLQHFRRVCVTLESVNEILDLFEKLFNKIKMFFKI